jgi:hypothetical protein
MGCSRRKEKKDMRTVETPARRGTARTTGIESELVS